MWVMHLSRSLLPKQWDEQGLFMAYIYIHTHTVSKKIIHYIEYVHAKEYESCKTACSVDYVCIEKNTKQGKPFNAVILLCFGNTRSSMLAGSLASSDKLRAAGAA